MTNIDLDAALVWKWVRMAVMHEHDIPVAPGIYVVSDVTRCAGFPVSVTPNYVGKTKDLRRRFQQHTDPIRSHSLNVFLKSWSAKAEFWFATCPAEQLDYYERHLIRTLKPAYNKVNYKG